MLRLCWYYCGWGMNSKQSLVILGTRELRYIRHVLECIVCMTHEFFKQDICHWSNYVLSLHSPPCYCSLDYTNMWAGRFVPCCDLAVSKTPHVNVGAWRWWLYVLAQMYCRSFLVVLLYFLSCNYRKPFVSHRRRWRHAAGFFTTSAGPAPTTNAPCSIT